MDCQKAQEEILDSLAETRAVANTRDLATHVAGCRVCRSFSEAQFMLHMQLSSTISAPALNPEFRKTLMKRVGGEPLSVWPTFLPDLAHAAGCVCAIALCLATLPFRPGLIMLDAVAFAIATYFVQIVLQSSLEAWEEEGW